RFTERSTVALAGEVTVLELCCCCLEPRTKVRREKLPMSFEVAGGGVKQSHLVLPIPWCGGCSARRTAIFSATIVAFFAGSIAIMAALALRWAPSARLFGGALVLGGIFALLLHALLVRVLQLPGHVAGCAAFGPGSAR